MADEKNGQQESEKRSEAPSTQPETGTAGGARLLPATPAGPVLVLRLRRPEKDDHVWEISGATVEVGRTEASQIYVPDPLVSRRHARIIPTGGRFVIEDLASANGTFLNGHKVTVPAMIAHGDQIEIGDTLLVAELRHGPESPPHPSRPSNRDINRPLYILWLLRSGRAHDWSSLAREFGASTEFVGTFEGMLLYDLKGLRDAGLVSYTGSRTGGDEPPIGPIKLSSNWTKLQTALNVSLTELVELGLNSMVVTPFLGRPRNALRPPQLFVLMPFDSDLKPVYEDHIINVATQLGLTVGRADDFFSAHSVMSDVWTAIFSARAIIADCTGRNPNVFYEIGLSHVLGKTTILITQNSDDVPFDIRHLRYIKYEYTPRGMRIFEKILFDTLKAELNLQPTPNASKLPIDYSC